MHFGNPLSSSPNPIFPVHLLPSLSFRRRKSSTDTTTSTLSDVSDVSAVASSEPPAHLSNSSSILRCGQCLADICPTTSIISKGFTGRHGRAFLVAPPSASARPARRYMRARDVGNLPNTTLDKAVPRQLVTGQHTVADLHCRMCDSVLGWKYVAAEEEGQRYKVGKFILETRKVVKGVYWEEDDAAAAAAAADTGAPTRPAGDEVEFDSQDEDECEDLFAGVWSPALAKKRRARKLIWKQDADVNMV